MGVFHKILPTAGWQGQRHWPRGTEYIAYAGGKKPVMYQSNVWGCGHVIDPATRRVYGWKYTDGVPGGVRTWLNRGVYDNASPTAYRGMSENILLSDRPGQGQIGADFWPPPPPKNESKMPPKSPKISSKSLKTVEKSCAPPPGAPMPSTPANPN